ncbi:hypothetical protein [Spirosoma panaciterrae]|uniref:hypothetical protein n=1 Tax=Spirosoma panaciterrae TaxID=496058 RepID=UPI00035E5A65|nr:hypothetical protein [Spirosoma panaciterrae]
MYYLIESFFVVSVAIVDDESVDMLVESEVIDVESETVVVDSVVSVLVLEQAVANASIESRKNADLAMFAMS